MGSSPLARGLRRPARPAGPWAGIIPARAGFTSGRELRQSRAQDHPRSRGVYSASARRAISAAGSSPLARGLRDERQHGGRLGRIIPARAGFTRGGSTPPPGAGDHPRSRGVYAHRTRGREQRMWIIPSRAGFTSISWCARGRSADHPRSRGVYRLLLGRQIRNHGSSPLARGLLSLCLTPRGRGADHPRSRGVYVFPWATGIPLKGSSPLARGLRPRPAPCRSAARIIPARAGFTPRSTGWPTPGPDHPRSRGVYP